MLPPVFGVLFDGIAYGMLLFVLSVGLSVTLGLMNFVNLAHCAFAMLGGYVSITLVNDFHWPFLATLPVAFIIAAAISVVFGYWLWFWLSNSATSSRRRSSLRPCCSAAAKAFIVGP